MRILQPTGNVVGRKAICTRPATLFVDVKADNKQQHSHPTENEKVLA
jgi:hypothetical protein